MWKESRYKRGERYNGVGFWPSTRYIKGRVLDIYEGIQSDILNTTRFDKNSDLSTTYLGKSNRSKNSKLKWRNLFPYQSKGIP